MINDYSDSKLDIQVKLKDGSVVDFDSFVIVQGEQVNEFKDLKQAENFVQDLHRENVMNFMITKGFGSSHSFINWYAKLDVFEKQEFIEKLVKVHLLED